MHSLRLLLSVATALLVSAALNFASAQNNVYSIDDDCYKAFEQAELALGTPEFPQALSQMIDVSEKKGDTKAQTLAAIMRLRGAMAAKDLPSVEAAFDAAKKSALETGYLQYYFHAYTQYATYCFNNDMQIRSLEIMSQMQEDAMKMNNQYGRWNCSKFMAALYLSTLRFSAAQKYYNEALEIHANTDDPVVKSQPLTRVYTDLSETYEYGSEQMKDCLLKAEETALTPIDSMRSDFYMSLYYAVEGDFDKSSSLRRRCTENGNFYRLITDGEALYSITDDALRGEWNHISLITPDLQEYHSLKYVYSLAYSLKNYRMANEVLNIMLDKMRDNVENQHTSFMAEIGARMDNDNLKEQLLEKTTSLNRVLRISVMIILLFVVVFIVLVALYILQLRREKRISDESNVAKTNFVQNMSHEIRTPLNAIVGFSQLLSLPDGMLTEAEKEQYGSYIKNSSSMLTMLIDDILDLSDVDSGNYQVNKGPCRCNELCRQAMSAVEFRVPAGVKYTFQSEVGDDLTIVSDERRIQQVVINFLTNACKHTNKGEIAVACALNDQKDRVKITVTDTGSGVAPQDAEVIFQRFAKLDRYKQGSGLGLNICRIIAKNLGGKVYLDTTYGRCSGNTDTGARFVFELPLKES